MATKKKSKLEMRAQRERDIIAECRTFTDEKRFENESKKASLIAKQREIEEQILYSFDSGDKATAELLLSKRNLTAQELDLCNGISQMYTTVYDVLSQLIVLADSMINLGNYKYLIKLIPEKMIPNVLASGQQPKIQKLISIVEELLCRLNEKITESMQLHQYHNRQVSMMNDVAREQRSKYLPRASEVEKQVSEIRKRVSTPINLPLPIEKEDQTVNTNKI